MLAATPSQSEAVKPTQSAAPAKSAAAPATSAAKDSQAPAGATNAQPATSQATTTQTVADQYDVTYPEVGVMKGAPQGVVPVPVKPIIPAGMPGTIQAAPVTDAEATADHPATPSWITVDPSGAVSAQTAPDDVAPGTYTYFVKLVFTADGSTKFVPVTFDVYLPYDSESFVPDQKSYTYYLHRTSGASLEVSADKGLPSFQVVVNEGDGTTYTETYNQQVDPKTGEITYVGQTNGVVLRGLTFNWVPKGESLYPGIPVGPLVPGGLVRQILKLIITIRERLTIRFTLAQVQSRVGKLLCTHGLPTFRTFTLLTLLRVKKSWGFL